jgi:3-aminobutyryl-CoA ammonia-lyase
MRKKLEILHDWAYNDRKEGAQMDQDRTNEGYKKFPVPEDDMEKITSTIRLRMSHKDAHYGGNLVDGAHSVHLFGDIATELLIRLDGDEGLFLRYDEIEFLAPVYAGDYIEARGEITHVGNTSRKMEFVAKKVVRARPDISPSAADFLDEPIVVCRAKGVCVTPRENKRK